MKKLALLLGTAIAAAALLVPAAMAKEIGSGGTVTPPPPVAVAAPCAKVDSIALKATKMGADLFRFEATGDYAVSSCSTNAETVSITVTFREYFTGVVWSTYLDQTVTLLPGKNTRGLLGFYGLPGRTTFAADIVVTDAATGAVLATRTGAVGTPAPKV